MRVDLFFSWATVPDEPSHGGVKPFLTSLLASLFLTSGCNLASGEDVEALSAELVTSQTRIDALTTQLESQSQRIQQLEARSSTLERIVSHRTMPPDIGTGQPTAPLDADQRRRLNEVGVDMLEKMANSGQAEETLESLGALTNAYLREATREIDARK